MLEMDQRTPMFRGYRWKPRRIKILRINPEILGMLCLQSASYKVTSGLPKDAHCLGAQIDVNTGDIFLKIESKEYEPVTEGELVPYLDANLLIIDRLDQDIGNSGIDTDHGITEMMIPPYIE